MSEKQERQKCECGSDLPHHLAEFMNNDKRMGHVCLCERKYAVRDMQFVCIGTSPHPFAWMRAVKT